MQESISSVPSQSHKKIELIIVDDCSTDNTSDIIKSPDDNQVISYISKIEYGYLTVEDVCHVVVNSD